MEDKKIMVKFKGRVLIDHLKRIFIFRLLFQYKKSAKRKSLGEGHWRTCEEASVATAGPKRPEMMALGARHQKKCKENTLTLY